MKRIVYLFAAVTMILFTAGCSGGNAGKSPKDIEKAIYNELQKGNYEKAVEMLGCRTMDFTHRPMTGYVLVDDSGMKTRKEFDFWINLALEFNKISKSSKRKK